MKDNEIITLLEYSLDVDQGTIRTQDELRTSPYWDSMSPVVVMALADSKFGKKLSAKSIQQCATVANLLRLLQPGISE